MYNIMNEYQQKIEALLFIKNQPLSYKWLARVLGISVTTVKDELDTMDSFYEQRGIQIVHVDDEVSLVTNKDVAQFTQEITKEEDAKELSKQALETLAIIIYKGKVTKAEIDYIRGVNAMYILRNLLVRGLIIKKTNQDDKRNPWYQPSLDLLSYLNINKLEELYDYDAVQEQLKNIEEQFSDEQYQESLEHNEE
jgi:segregation and condensation protein B